MAITNLFDYIKFPDQEQRKKIQKEYFDTQKLFLNIEPYLTLNNLQKKIKVNIFDSESLFAFVNKDLREKIRRYNNDIFSLTLSLFSMVNYYSLMNNAEGDDKMANESLFRKAARCVCAEMFMYEEKIKNLVRQIFSFDMRKTRRPKDLMAELNKKAQTNVQVQNFCDTVNSYFNHHAVIFVMNIRDNEIHNDSLLDEYSDAQELSEGVISFCNPYYIVSNDELYDNIRQALVQQAILNNSLQSILDNHRI